MRILVYGGFILYIIVVVISGIPLRIKLKKKYPDILKSRRLDNLTADMFEHCEQTEELKEILARLKIYQAYSLTGFSIWGAVIAVDILFFG
ncbi:hypothetical protein V1L52_10460 [Treponema sp. HNW]|uniref:hypothetical protein n=1 Tax=Treponema sp. HNW TaxID=3116654 RepID=UPI003D09778D